MFPEGRLGPILAAGRRAALALADRLGASDRLRLHVEPELDIVTYFPARGERAGEHGDRRPDPAAITAASERMLALGTQGPDPVWLSTLRVDAGAFAAGHPDLPAPERAVTILRCVLMRPEHESWGPDLHRRLEALAAAVD